MLKIQAVVRSFLVRNNVKRLQDAVVTLQSRLRGFLTRRELMVYFDLNPGECQVAISCGLSVARAIWIFKVSEMDGQKDTCSADAELWTSSNQTKTQSIAKAKVEDQEEKVGSSDVVWTAPITEDEMFRRIQMLWAREMRRDLELQREMKKDLELKREIEWKLELQREIELNLKLQAFLIAIEQHRRFRARL